jgi:hypothetical protein
MTDDNKLQQQQQQVVLRADGPGDVEYFRQQVKPLMQMQPGNDLPELLIGTKVRAAAMQSSKVGRVYP